MIHTVNAFRSPVLTIPTSLALNDEMIFNATGEGTTGMMIGFNVPVGGTYEVELWGANGSEGNIGNRPLPNAVPGKGGGIRGQLNITASENLLLIVGQNGAHTGNQVNDGAAGASGGGTFLFVQTAQGAFRIASANYRLLALAASGGGTNDYGYQGQRTDGADAQDVIRDSNYGTASTTIPGYCSTLFAGTIYTRGASMARGGYGGGLTSDDSPPNAVGYDIAANRAGTNFFHLAGVWLGLNQASDRQFNGLAVFRLRVIKDERLFIDDNGFNARGSTADFTVRTATQTATLKGVAGI